MIMPKLSTNKICHGAGSFPAKTIVDTGRKGKRDKMPTPWNVSFDESDLPRGMPKNPSQALRVCSCHLIPIVHAQHLRHLPRR